MNNTKIIPTCFVLCHEKVNFAKKLPCLASLENSVTSNVMCNKSLYCMYLETFSLRALFSLWNFLASSDCVKRNQGKKLTSWGKDGGV